MSVKLLTEHRLEFVSEKGGCTGSSESTLVKMPLCVAAQFMIYWLRADAYDTLGGTSISQRKGKIQTSTTNQVFHACMCAVSCSSSLIFFFISCKPMKRRHSYAIMFCVLSPLSCAKSHRVLPES